MINGKPRPANAPMGVARGLCPGRVVWVHDKAATNWPTSKPDFWYDHIDAQVAYRMLTKAVRTYARADSEALAWQAIFRHFNRSKKRGDVGYVPGERIVIKINLTTCYATAEAMCDENYNWRPKLGLSHECTANSPQLCHALVDHLVNVVGVRQSDIWIGDPACHVPNFIFDALTQDFPAVHYWDSRGTWGRTRCEFSAVPFYWSTTQDNQGKLQDYVPQAYVDASYVINSAVLKSHELAGVSLCAKNHYGSLLRTPTGRLRGYRDPLNYYNLHNCLARGGQPDFYRKTGQYRALVDLMGHEAIGAKTLLHILDGLFAGKNWKSEPSQWGLSPFNGDWPKSLFVSMDPVAIDSVGYDFLREQWPEHAGCTAATDYLVEAALAHDPPSGSFYDPEADGHAMQSLGTHEHWNNPLDKQYSRNLAPINGTGIELVHVEGSSAHELAATSLRYNR